MSVDVHPMTSYSILRIDPVKSVQVLLVLLGSPGFSWFSWIFSFFQYGFDLEYETILLNNWENGGRDGASVSMVSYNTDVILPWLG